jgi:hypothetical protein
MNVKFLFSPNISHDELCHYEHKRLRFLTEPGDTQATRSRATGRARESQRGVPLALDSMIEATSLGGDSAELRDTRFWGNSRDTAWATRRREHSLGCDLRRDTRDGGLLVCSLEKSADSIPGQLSETRKLMMSKWHPVANLKFVIF